MKMGKIYIYKKEKKIGFLDARELRSDDLCYLLIQWLTTKA
jgi:hypothetical protein